MVSFAIIKSSHVITSIKCQLLKEWNFAWTRAFEVTMYTKKFGLQFLVKNLILKGKLATL